jgi:hypothetical protein
MRELLRWSIDDLTASGGGRDSTAPLLQAP